MIAYLLCGSLFAQQYQVSTTQNDAFSMALVKLMNAAPNAFADLKGDAIRSTSLMGDDYKLNIDFPGSRAGIVRYRDWDKNAYVEFGGYETKAAMLKGVKDIVNRIKFTLGDQFFQPFESL